MNNAPPVDDKEFLDWVFDRAVEFIEEGRDPATDELAIHRPDLQQQVNDLIELARKVAFGPRTHRPAIPGYHLLQEIGSGGMGSVWLSRQEKLGGRLVAIKILPHSLVYSQRLRSRFRAEAQAIAKLRHPNIVDVYDVIESEGVNAYAMEWVEGSTLADVIKRAKDSDCSQHGLQSSMGCVREALGSEAGAVGTPMDRSYIVFVCRVGVAIARALSAVHRAGLVHRDVKPSNILLRHDGTPLLSDFGLVRDPDSTVVTQLNISAGGQFAGTAAFAPPEQLRADAGEIDGRADVYSLGATLYSALALRIPFQGQNHVAVLRQIELGLATPLRTINPKLPRDLQTVIATAMEPDRSQRYQTADELADDLERLLNLQPIRAKPVGWIGRTAKLARRNRTTLAAATAGGMLTVSVIALALIYFIGFPIWSKQHLNEARLVLLDPEQSNALFSALYFQQVNPAGVPISNAAAQRALVHYDAAARFAPFDEAIALERELIQVAQQIINRNAPAPVNLNKDAQLSLTAAYASRPSVRWQDALMARNPVRFGESQLLAASSDDLRSLGLLALLCSDPTTTMDAWAAFDLKNDPDPLVEASFGIVYLISKQYGRAYPRLRNAVAAFPNVGFLTAYLAEAAMMCGDLEKAQQWLDEAKSMPRLDRFNGVMRVQAGLFAAAGNDDEARRVYEQLFAERSNIVAFDEYVRYLESHGDLERAMVVYLRLISFGGNFMQSYERFIDATERWWAGLDEADRRQLVEAHMPWTDHRHDREGILTTYTRCLQELGREVPPDGVPPVLAEAP